MSVPFFPISTPPLDAVGGRFIDVWRRFFEGITGSIATLTGQINGVPGVNYFTIATQPSLGPTDVGYVGFETDTGHFVYFDGAAWQLLGSGDAPGRFDDFAVAPSSGWQLCDGTATTYLVLGAATLSTTAFTTPNLRGTPSYRKSGAAYTGTVNAKSGSTATGTTGAGSTATGTTGTGTSGDESTHTHGAGSFITNTGNNVFDTVSSGTGVTPSDAAHTHLVTGTSGAGSAHSHSVPGLSIPSLAVAGVSVPALGVGTLDMANVVCLPYFRR